MGRWIKKNSITNQNEGIVNVFGIFLSCKLKKSSSLFIGLSSTDQYTKVKSVL